MKKWLIIAGFVVAFSVGTMTSGLSFSSASNNSGFDNSFNNRVSENNMWHSKQGDGMMHMAGHSSGMHMMANMHRSDRIDTMSMMNEVMVNLFTEAAETLGMTVEQLQTQLQSGKSLETILEEHGLIKDEFVERLEVSTHKDIESFKKEGSLTTHEKEEMLSFMGEHIGIMLNSNGMFACGGFGESNYSSY